MLASTLQTPFALSALDAAFYQEHGWVTAPTVLDDSLIDAALAGLDQHWTGHRDWTLAGARTHFVDWMPGDGAGTRNNEYLSLQNEKVRRLAWCSAIGSIAAAAAETTEIRLFDDQIINKPGGQTNAVVGWHVDADYWRTCSSKNMLTAWVPLHDCPEEMGPLVVLDGSHKWSHKIDRSILSFNSPDMDLLKRHVEELSLECKPVTVSMQSNQFSLHNCLAVHASYPNRGSRPRVAPAVHLQDHSNHYQAATKPDGRPVQIYNDLICSKDADGKPEFKDDSIFPVFWPAESETLPQNGARC